MVEVRPSKGIQKSKGSVLSRWQGFVLKGLEANLMFLPRVYDEMVVQDADENSLNTREGSLWDDNHPG